MKQMRNIFSAEFYQKRYSKKQVKGIAIKYFVLFVLSIFFTTFNLNAQNTKNASSPLKKGDNISTLQQDRVVDVSKTKKVKNDDSILSASKDKVVKNDMLVIDCVPIDYDKDIFIVTEECAMFPGGMDSLDKFIANNLVYPTEAKEKGIQGKVYVTFLVEKDGSLCDIKVLRDIGYGCGEAAVDLVKKMPKWTPACLQNYIVRQQFNLPITFSLK